MTAPVNETQCLGLGSEFSTTSSFYPARALTATDCSTTVTSPNPTRTGPISITPFAFGVFYQSMCHFSRQNNEKIFLITFLQPFASTDVNIPDTRPSSKTKSKCNQDSHLWAKQTIQVPKHIGFSEVIERRLARVLISVRWNHPSVVWISLCEELEELCQIPQAHFSEELSNLHFALLETKARSSF